MRVRKGGPGRPFFISRPTQTKIPTSGKTGQKWGTQYSLLSLVALNLCEYESRLLTGGRYAAILDLRAVGKSPFLSKQVKIPTSGKASQKWGTQYTLFSFGALNLCEYESRLLTGGRYAAILELREVEESPFSIETNENPHFSQRQGEMGHPIHSSFIWRVEPFEYESRSLTGGTYAPILELSEVEESPFSIETNENPHFSQRRGEMGHPVHSSFIWRVEPFEYESRSLTGGKSAAILELSEVEESPFSIETNENPHFWQTRPEMGHPAHPSFIFHSAP